MAYFEAYNALFEYQKANSGKYPWLEPRDITCLDTFGTLPTAAIKRNFCSNFQKTGIDGSNGSTRPGSDTA
jgi:hypothetical protein